MPKLIICVFINPARLYKSIYIKCVIISKLRELQSNNFLPVNLFPSRDSPRVTLKSAMGVKERELYLQTNQNIVYTNK